jgi:hypothetical protein
LKHSLFTPSEGIRLLDDAQTQRPAGRCGFNARKLTGTTC